MSENTTPTNKLQKNAELIFTYVYNNRIIFISFFLPFLTLLIAIPPSILYILSESLSCRFRKTLSIGSDGFQKLCIILIGRHTGVSCLVFQKQSRAAVYRIHTECL